jgi:hypothetical protein
VRGATHSICPTFLANKYKALGTRLRKFALVNLCTALGRGVETQRCGLGEEACERFYEPDQSVARETMSDFRILLTAISAMALFLYGVQVFIHDIQRVGGATFAKWLGRLTRSGLRALVVGAVATAPVSEKCGERTVSPFFLLQPLFSRIALGCL